VQQEQEKLLDYKVPKRNNEASKDFIPSRVF